MKLKSTPDDFVVKEILNYDLDMDGMYALFLMEKRGMGHMQAMDELAGFLKIPGKNIGYAGIKDKEAVTQQTISIKGMFPARAEQFCQVFKNDRLRFTYIGQSKKPIVLGDNVGNAFTVRIRELTPAQTHFFHAVPAQMRFVNYFDDQRFSMHNVAIGRHIIKKEWSAALALIDHPDTKRYAGEHPQDPIGAIKKVPHRLATLYVNAYQSYLFNAGLSEYLHSKYSAAPDATYSLGKLSCPKELPDDFLVPLPGFGTESDDFPLLWPHLQKLLDIDGIRLSDFVTRSLPELASAGDVRSACTVARDITVLKEPTDADPCVVLITFSLSKGAYATMFVKYLMAQVPA